jgi:DNA-binding PadR family transcriptional regulator
MTKEWGLDSRNVQTDTGAHRASYAVTGAGSRELKRQEREAD